MTTDNLQTGETVSACAGCGGRFDPDDPIQKTFAACRKCVGIYGRLDTVIEEKAKRKKREILDKFAMETQG
jgi:hypothetical protein